MVENTYDYELIIWISTAQMQVAPGYELSGSLLSPLNAITPLNINSKIKLVGVYMEIYQHSAVRMRE